MPALTLGSQQLEVVEKFLYLGSYVSAGSGASDEIYLRIVKAMVA